MTDRVSEEATVLVADDERQLADLYTDFLAGEYDVVTAYGGEEAKALLADPSFDVDVALLDRRMPDLSGDKVLAAVTDSGRDVRVAMVTAVNPGFDIIDMGCDEYLVKPVDRAEMLDVVDRLLRLSEYSEKHRALTSKKLKRNVLEVEKNAAELADSDRFQRLETEIDALEDELDDISEDLAFEDVQRHI
ncbi:MAG: response regulator [Haloarculaceae archaeon]